MVLALDFLWVLGLLVLLLLLPVISLLWVPSARGAPVSAPIALSIVLGSTYFFNYFFSVSLFILLFS